MNIEDLPIEIFTYKIFPYINDMGYIHTISRVSKTLRRCCTYYQIFIINRCVETRKTVNKILNERIKYGPNSHIKIHFVSWIACCYLCGWNGTTLYICDICKRKTCCYKKKVVYSRDPDRESICMRNCKKCGLFSCYKCFGNDSNTLCKICHKDNTYVKRNIMVRAYVTNGLIEHIVQYFGYIMYVNVIKKNSYKGTIEVEYMTSSGHRIYTYNSDEDEKMLGNLHILSHGYECRKGRKLITPRFRFMHNKYLRFAIISPPL